MGRIFEIEYTVRTVKKMNNVYAKAFYIGNFKIDGVEQEWDEFRVSYGYVNFKDGIKKLKRKYNYNKIYDSFYCYEIAEGEKKLLKSVSSTEDKIVICTPGYGEPVDIAIKSRFMIKKEWQDMKETNFATKGCIECLREKEGIIMQKIRNVYINEKEGVTVIVFNNGDKVRVTREKGEKNDVEKAIAIAIIKYYFGLDYYINACDKVVKAEKKEKVKKTTKKTNK